MITPTWLATLGISWQIDLPTYKRTDWRLQRTDYTRTSWRTEKRTTMTTLIYLLLTLCLTCTGSAQDVSPEAWFIPGGKTLLIHNSWTLIMSIKLENYNVHFKRLEWETQEFRRSVERQLISATTNRTEFNDYKTIIMRIVNQEIDQFQGELIALKRFHSELQTTVCGQRRRNNNRNKRGIFNWFRRQLTSKSTMEKMVEFARTYATVTGNLKKSDQESHRRRRAVFNFMQPILTGLFGIASDDQLQNLTYYEIETNY